DKSTDNSAATQRIPAPDCFRNATSGLTPRGKRVTTMVKNNSGLSRSCRCRKATRTSLANTAIIARTGPMAASSAFNDSCTSAFIVFSRPQRDELHAWQLQIVMGSNYHGAALGGTLLQQRLNGFYTGRIDGGEHLIEQPEWLIGNEQASQGYPSLLTCRQIAAGHVLEARKAGTR